MLLSVLTPLLSRPTFFTLSSHNHFCYRSEGMFLMAMVLVLMTVVAAAVYLPPSRAITEMSVIGEGVAFVSA